LADADLAVGREADEETLVVKLHPYAERVTMAAKSTVLIVGSLALAPLAGSVKAEDKSLYQRLGGYDAIAAVSDEFIARLANDEPTASSKQIWCHSVQTFAG
jgi:hypothetical protein